MSFVKKLKKTQPLVSSVEPLLKEKLDLKTLRGPHDKRTRQPDQRRTTAINSGQIHEPLYQGASWQKRGFVFQRKGANVAQDYAPEVLKKRNARMGRSETGAEGAELKIPNTLSKPS